MGPIARWLAIACLFVATVPAAQGAYFPTPIDFPSTSTGITSVAVTTNPTMLLRINGASSGSLVVYIQLVRASATALGMTCQTGPSTTILAPVSVANVNNATGAITMVPASWSYTVSSSTVARMVVAPVNDQFISCTFSATGAASGDLITVYARYGS